MEIPVDMGIDALYHEQMRALVYFFFFHSALSFALSSDCVDLVSVHDGDTFRVIIKSETLFREMPVRLKGIDTPELDCERGPLAKAFTEQVLRKAKCIKLVEIQRDKYFRILSKVSVDGRDLTELLISKGTGRAYFGGKRQGCF